MKTAIVFGGFGDIGKAIVKNLWKEHDKIYMVYSKDLDSAFIKKNYTRMIIPIKCDLSDIQNIPSAISSVANVDTIIFAQGVTSKDNWTKVMDINLNGPHFALEALLNRINPQGRIIFISSILGAFPHSLSLSYGVSKAGINALVKNMVKFLPQGTTINAIAPGFIDTKWHKNKDNEIIESIKGKIALKRFGTIEEVASLCIEIIKNGYINGSILDIHGGYDYK